MSSTDLEPTKEVKSQSTPEIESDDKASARMTFTSHLGELRSRLIKAVVSVIICFCICYAFSNKIIEVMSQPLKQKSVAASDSDPNHAATSEESVEGGENADVAVSDATASEEPIAYEWIITGPFEAFFVKLKFSAYGAILLGYPFIMYQMCAFIFPGLKPSERRVINVLVFGCTTLAVVGALTAFFFVIPLVIPILMSYTPDWVKFMPRLSETLALVFKAILGFAIAFQFPPVLLTCVYLGVLEPDTLKNNRRLAMVILFVLAAVLTPQDPISMVIMAIPLILLYEISVWIAVLIVRKKTLAEAR
jgi:sec-independent protein translocase protein TatC